MFLLLWGCIYIKFVNFSYIFLCIIFTVLLELFLCNQLLIDIYVIILVLNSLWVLGVLLLGVDGSHFPSCFLLGCPLGWLAFWTSNTLFLPPGGVCGAPLCSACHSAAYTYVSWLFFCCGTVWRHCPSGMWAWWLHVADMLLLGFPQWELHGIVEYPVFLGRGLGVCLAFLAPLGAIFIAYPGI